jgi:hypothetical protein
MFAPTAIADSKLWQCSLPGLNQMYVYVGGFEGIVDSPEVVKSPITAVKRRYQTSSDGGRHQHDQLESRAQISRLADTRCGRQVDREFLDSGEWHKEVRISRQTWSSACKPRTMICVLVPRTPGDNRRRLWLATFAAMSSPDE